MVNVEWDEENIFDTIKRIVVTVDQNVYFAFAAYGLTFSQYKIIEYLYINRTKKISQIDIEKYYSLRNPTVTRLLQALEKKGFVERIPDSQDQRKKNVSLTGNALPMIDELLKIRKNLDGWLEKDLSEEERRQLLSSLKKVLHVAVHNRLHINSQND